MNSAAELVMEGTGVVLHVDRLSRVVMNGSEEEESLQPRFPQLHGASAPKYRRPENNKGTKHY